eukprot:scaffold675503_cov57-Prasinocladus_malaysianus.AAC.1
MFTGDAGGRLKCGEIVAFEPIYAQADLTNGGEDASAIMGDVTMMQTSPDTLSITVSIIVRCTDNSD